MRQVKTDNSSEWLSSVTAGETISLSGVVYTARDAAHKKIFELLQQGKELPFPIRGAFIYYAGPTPAPEGRVCGAFGPTTSCRMDRFAPDLYRMGLSGTIGKGGRNEAVRQAILESKSVYLIAVGGAGAFCSKHITKYEEIAFPELGCESVKKLEFTNFPLTVAIDSLGNDIFEDAKEVK